MRLTSYLLVLAALASTHCTVAVDSQSSESVESSEQADTAWADGTYARIRDDGRLYSTHSYTDLLDVHVIAAAAGSNWAAAHPLRFSIMVSAMNEVRAGLCGDAARARYNASGAWCSEFVRWNFINAGVDNVSTCGSWVTTCQRGGCYPPYCGSRSRYRASA